MSNDEMIQKIAAQIQDNIPRYNTLPPARKFRPDIAELNRLAKKISENMEDYYVEPTIHPNYR